MDINTMIGKQSWYNEVCHQEDTGGKILIWLKLFELFSGVPKPSCAKC